MLPLWIDLKSFSTDIRVNTGKILVWFCVTLRFFFCNATTEAIAQHIIVLISDPYSIPCYQFGTNQKANDNGSL
jgi:hypothetical protein